MTLLPVEKLPPMLFGSPFRSKRTRTRAIAALPGPTKRARISLRLSVAAVFVETTLGLADTEAELEAELNNKGSAGAMLPAPDCTSTVSVFETPPADATTSIDPALAGAVYE